MAHFLCYIVLLSLALACQAQVNLGGLMMALPDIQELLSAYNKKDYVQAAVKLIDLKLKIDPPKKGSSAERRLLHLKRILQFFHSYYLRMQEQVSKFRKDMDNLTSRVDTEKVRVIEQAINFLDMLECNIDNVIENLKDQLRRLLGDDYLETYMLDTPAKSTTKRATGSPTKAKRKPTSTTTTKPMRKSGSKRNVCIPNKAIKKLDNEGEMQKKKKKKKKPQY